MTLLFDTNAWIRLAECPEAISPKACQQIQGATGPAFLSVISIWEVCLKIRKGKLELSMPLDEWLTVMLRPSLVTVLNVDTTIARAANALPGDFHEDPADRLIVATARHRDLTLVTSDALIISYPHVLTLDTR
jgi:PIN domain nuclease of toxin-antitoxin system